MRKLLIFIFTLAFMLSCCNTAALAFTTNGDDFPYLSSDFEEALTTDKFYRSKNAYFKDEAGIFGDEQTCSDIYDDIQETADNIDMNIAVFIGGLFRSDETTEKFSSNGSEFIFGKGEDVNSVFLYLDFEGQSMSYDYIDTFHDAKFYVTESDVDDIFEDMDDYLPKSGETVYESDVSKALDVFLADLQQEKSNGADHNAFYYNEEAGKYHFSFFGNIFESSLRPYRNIVFFLVLSIVIAVIAAAMYGKSIRKKYKFRDLQKASAYTSDNRIVFNDSQDIFLGSHVSRVKLQSSSGGGGHGGGGGGSHGGGGHHR